MEPVKLQFDRMYSSAAEPSPKVRERIAWTTAHVPPEATWILDVGAGRGRIANVLYERGHRVVALDLSRHGLQYCQASKVQGSAVQLPFRCQAYDLVLCAEVIEHLTPESRYSLLQEIDRVSRRYILLTVPNNEDLREMQIKCNRCQNLFHAHGHLASFTLSALERLFPYKPVKLLTSGHREATWIKPLLTIRQQVLGCYAWDTFLVCPECHNTEITPPQRTIAVKVLDKVNYLMGRRREGGWLLALFDKQS